MAREPQSLEGWEPVLGEDVTLAGAIELAFNYRGDVTIVKVDGGQVEGYVYNRRLDGDPPFLQLYKKDNGEPLTLTYGQVGNIRFTGKDTAAGKSYEAWKQRKEQESRES